MSVVGCVVIYVLLFKGLGFRVSLGYFWVV